MKTTNKKGGAAPQPRLQNHPLPKPRTVATPVKAVDTGSGADVKTVAPGAERLEMSDAQLEDFTRRINIAIHELVFAVQHMDQGDVEETQNAFVTVLLSLQAIEMEYDTLALTQNP